MPRVKPCARCHHPKSRHRTRECRHTWQTRGQTFTGISTITKWCTCDGYQPPTAGDQVSRRDEAAEAAKGTSVSPGPYPTLPEMLRDWADTARKADTILKDILNEVETLNALPVGTVIRIGTRAYVHTAAWEWVETVTGTAYTADELDTEAIIIYQPEEDR